MTRDQAEELVRTLFAMYPRARMPQMTIDVYCASLDRYEAGPLSRALSSVAEESEYVPSLAAIHKRMGVGADHRPEESNERAIATAPDRTCRVCKGCGWVDAEERSRAGEKRTVVMPCSCRGGAIGDVPVLDRVELPEELQEAMTEFETALGQPLFGPALGLLARDLASPHPGLALDRLRKATLFAKARSVGELVAQMGSGA